MRLWSYQILPYLPNSQLLAQKRECDLILKDWHNGKKTNHILINYIHECSDFNFVVYYTKLYMAFKERNFKFNDKYDVVNMLLSNSNLDCYKDYHNKEYLTICFMNLKEKYIRGQKDFSKEIYDRLCEFYAKEMVNNG